MTIRYAKPAILERLGDSHCVIEASAGTGKTYTLEHLVVDLVLQGIPLEKILVVTFTVKATLELKARVRAKLEELVALEPGADAAAEGCAWELDEAAMTALRAALSTFDRATISTIHGFCQQVLQDAAFESGRLFSQEAISSDAAFDRAFKTLVRTRLAFGAQRPLFERALDRLKGLDGLGGFLKAAMKEGGHLDLPDPGALRAPLEAFPEAEARAFLAEVKDHYAIADSKKRPRGPLLTALGAAKVTGASYRGMGEKLEALLRGRALARVEGNPGLFWAEVDAEDLSDLSDKLAKADPTGVIGPLAAACGRLKDQGFDFLAVLASAFLPPLVEELDRYKREAGVFDFDDMIRLVRIAVLSPEGEPLVGRLRDRFQAALIDEFQDTDAAQWDIFRRVFLESGEHRLILVGDPKQAIYGFRSGDLPTYLEAVRSVTDFTGRPLEELSTNFRSTSGLIEAYCEVFQGAPDSPFFTGGNGERCRAAVACGRPGLCLTDAQGRTLPPIRVVEAEAGKAGPTRRSLAAGLAWAIRETLQEGGVRFGEGAKAAQVAPEDIFVLTRSASEGLEMALALKALGVPSAFFKQDGLFETAEALAVRDLLLAMEAPLQESLRGKALLGPFFGLSFAEVEASRDLPESHPVLKRLFAWRDLARAGRFGECFSRVLSESGVTQRLLFLEEGARALTNIHHLLDLLQGEALGRQRTLVDLAVVMQRWISGVERPTVEDGDAQRLEREAGAVQILTMHKSKGLEAKVVAVYGGFSSSGNKAVIHRYHDAGRSRRAWVGSLKGAPAQVQAWAAEEEAEEWERLLYVALTRAKGQLILPRIVPGPATGGATPFDAATGDPKGPYGCVNRRLRGMLGLPSERIHHPRFSLDPVREALPPAGGDLAARLGVWNPVLPPEPALPDFKALAGRGRPFWTFSYTSLAHGLTTGFRAPLGDGEAWEEHTEPILGAAEEGPRGGARLGTLVHEALQAVPLESFQERSQAEWLADPATALLLRELPPEARRAAGLWIHQAFAGPLPLPCGGTVVLSRAAPMLRELDFLTPYPDREDLLTGSIDLLFRWEGLAYVLDWKTSRLASYGPEALARKMEEDYLIQVKAYTLATCRFLGIDSLEAYEAGFGGILYVFLRGLPEGGVWTLRPSWEEVRAWERDLAALPVESLIPAHAGGARHV